MVAGINGASNSPANKKKTTNVAWSPAPPKQNKGESGSVGLYILKKQYTKYRVEGGTKDFTKWREEKGK
jgi:predicted nucleic acid-binding Zn ribbon protein